MSSKIDGSKNISNYFFNYHKLNFAVKWICLQLTVTRPLSSTCIFWPISKKQISKKFKVGRALVTESGLHCCCFFHGLQYNAVKLHSLQYYTFDVWCSNLLLWPVYILDFLPSDTQFSSSPSSSSFYWLFLPSYYVTDNLPSSKKQASFPLPLLILELSISWHFWLPHQFAVGLMTPLILHYIVSLFSREFLSSIRDYHWLLCICVQLNPTVWQLVFLGDPCWLCWPQTEAKFDHASVQFN